MKKKVKIVIIILLIVVLAVCAWFIGYHTRKSQDNLPSLESIVEMDEADINDLLVGYRNYQLDDVWEGPDIKSDNTWIWKIDEHTQLQVSCNNKDKVVVCSLDSIFQAKILEIFDSYYLVEPVEGSPELRSSDRIEVKMEHLDPSLEPEVGDIIEIIHSGEIMESDPARLQDVYSIRVVKEEAYRNGKQRRSKMRCHGRRNYIVCGWNKETYTGWRIKLWNRLRISVWSTGRNH